MTLADRPADCAPGPLPGQESSSREARFAFRLIALRFDLIYDFPFFRGEAIHLHCAVSDARVLVSLDDVEDVVAVHAENRSGFGDRGAAGAGVGLLLWEHVGLHHPAG